MGSSGSNSVARNGGQMADASPVGGKARLPPVIDGTDDDDDALSVYTEPWGRTELVARVVAECTGAASNSGVITTISGQDLSAATMGRSEGFIPPMSASWPASPAGHFPRPPLPPSERSLGTSGLALLESPAPVCHPPRPFYGSVQLLSSHQSAHQANESEETTVLPQITHLTAHQQLCQWQHQTINLPTAKKKSLASVDAPQGGQPQQPPPLATAAVATVSVLRPPCRSGAGAVTPPADGSKPSCAPTNGAPTVMARPPLASSAASSLLAAEWRATTPSRVALLPLSFAAGAAAAAALAPCDSSPPPPLAPITVRHNHEEQQFHGDQVGLAPATTVSVPHPPVGTRAKFVLHYSPPRMRARATPPDDNTATPPIISSLPLSAAAMQPSQPALGGSLRQSNDSFASFPGLPDIVESSKPPAGHSSAADFAMMGALVPKSSVIVPLPVLPERDTSSMSDEFSDLIDQSFDS